MFRNGSNCCFITLKNNKANFLNKVCLLNPAKHELDIISKSILSDRINTRLNFNQVNQWKDTSEVIKWFNNIGNKQKRKFILFDIKDFHSTITKDLLTKSLLKKKFKFLTRIKNNISCKKFFTI